VEINFTPWKRFVKDFENLIELVCGDPERSGMPNARLVHLLDIMRVTLPRKELESVNACLFSTFEATVKVRKTHVINIATTIAGKP